MSNQTSHLDAGTELDASIDAMADQLAAAGGGSGGAGGGGGAGQPAVALIDAPIPNPPVAATAQVAESDALLAEIASEIEQQAPGPLPTPPEPVASVPLAPPPAPTPAEIAEAAEDVQADLEAFEAPSATEIAAIPDPPAPEADIAKPGAEMRSLDAALAARAERSLLTTPAPAVEPVPVAPQAVVAAPAPAAPPKPEAQPEPIIIASPAEPVPAPAAQPGSTRAAFVDTLTAPLRPIAAMHEKLGEPTRQLVGYLALITLFFAACIWTFPRFMKASTPDPTTAPTEFYDANTPAHGITAPAKHAEGEKAAGHGGEEAHGESGHGEAKKADAHAKPKPEKKSPSKGKKAPPAEGHGEH